MITKMGFSSNDNEKTDVAANIQQISTRWQTGVVSRRNPYGKAKSHAKLQVCDILHGQDDLKPVGLRIKKHAHVPTEEAVQA